MKQLVFGALTLVWLRVLAVSAQVDVYFSAAGVRSCTGTCVPRQHCKQNDDEPASLASLRYAKNYSDVVGDCPHYLEICCSRENLLVVPTVTRQLDRFGACGKSNPFGDGVRIVEGKIAEAEFGEFPWTLLVLEKQRLVDDHTSWEVYACVGSLIAPNVALTGAHCVVNRTASNLVVRAGEWDTRTEAEVVPHQNAQVKEVLVHEGYNRYHHFDVALLVLTEPFHAEDNVQTVCLPPPGLRPYAGTECISAGWGKDRFGQTGVYQQILKRVSLPIVETGKCQEALRTTRLGPKFKLHSTFLCAGGNGANVCTGDGGAALVCRIPGTENAFYQAGIVAWGIRCGEKNIPGVFVNVLAVRSWIVDKLNSLSVEPALYTP